MMYRISLFLVLVTINVVAMEKQELSVALQPQLKKQKTDGPRINDPKPVFFFNYYWPKLPSGVQRKIVRMAGVFLPQVTGTSNFSCKMAVHGINPHQPNELIIHENDALMIYDRWTGSKRVFCNKAALGKGMLVAYNPCDENEILTITNKSDQLFLTYVDTKGNPKKQLQLLGLDKQKISDFQIDPHDPTQVAFIANGIVNIGKFKEDQATNTVQFISSQKEKFDNPLLDLAYDPYTPQRIFLKNSDTVFVLDTESSASSIIYKLHRSSASKLAVKKNELLVWDGEVEHRICFDELIPQSYDRYSFTVNGKPNEKVIDWLKMAIVAKKLDAIRNEYNPLILSPEEYIYYSMFNENMRSAFKQRIKIRPRSPYQQNFSHLQALQDIRAIAEKQEQLMTMFQEFIARTAAPNQQSPGVQADAKAPIGNDDNDDDDKK